MVVAVSSNSAGRFSIFLAGLISDLMGVNRPVHFEIGAGSTFLSVRKLASLPVLRFLVGETSALAVSSASMALAVRLVPAAIRSDLRWDGLS